MSKLRGMKPRQIIKRLKIFIFGEAKVGKTSAVIEFPNAYIIDGEKGCDEYYKSIEKSNSLLFQTTNFFELKQEIMTLRTEQHEFKTIIIDPITKYYQSIQEIWTSRFEKEAIRKHNTKAAEMQDFGLRYWGKVKRDYNSLLNLLYDIDMNVIITAHQKDVYGEDSKKVGVTFDSMRDDDYFFDYIFRLEKRGKDIPDKRNPRYTITVGQRKEIEEKKFPPEFVWSYENFCKYYGRDILEKRSEPVQLALPNQVKRLNALIEVIKLEDNLLEKWYEKAGVDSPEQFTDAQISKCIAYCESKLKELDLPDDFELEANTSSKKSPPPKKGRTKKKVSEAEMSTAIHKVKERLELLEIPHKKLEEAVLALIPHLIEDYSESVGLSMEDYEKMYDFLGKVKARKGHDIEKDLFRSIKAGLEKEE